MPTRAQAKRLIEQLDALDVHNLARRLTVALRRDAIGSGNDGFPRGGGGGGDTTIMWCFTHERGDCPCAVSVDVPHDPTGNAASATIDADPDARHAYDQLHDELEHALAHLEHAVPDLRAIAKRLDKIDGWAASATRNAPPGCAVMARVGVFEEVYRRVPIHPGGEPVPLGMWAYKFHRNNDRLPVDSEAEQRATNKDTKVHARMTVITDKTTGLEQDLAVADRRRKRMVPGA